MSYYHEKRFKINEPFIDIICSKFSLTEYQTEEVKRHYFKSLEHYLSQGRMLEITIGAIIYYVLKKNGFPKKMKLIAKKLNVKEKLLFKALRKIKREMMLKY